MGDMFVHYYLCAMARSSEGGAAGVKSRPLVVGNSLEDIFGSHRTVVVTKAEGDGWMGLRRRRKATSALMNACQHELPLDVAIIIRKKVRVQ